MPCLWLLLLISGLKYALSLVVEHGGSGSSMAAPIARDILSYVLAEDKKGGDLMLLFRFLFRLPWLLLFSTAALVLIGTLALYSASEGSWTPWAERQILRAAIGTVLLFLIAFIPTRWLYNWSYLGIVLAVLVLATLPFIGVGVGATRWIALGPFNFQPSEPAKLAVIIALARYLSSQTPEQMQSFVTYVPVLGLDSGALWFGYDTARSGHLFHVIGWRAGCCVFAAGLPRRYVFSALIAGVAALPVLWSQLYSYQKARILTFLNPESDLLGAGYQIAQSKIALGSGGLFGKGFLMGSQSQLNYLPEKQTDFVFTMIGEEFGFVGNLAVLFTYFVILASCLMIAVRCRNRFGQLLCTGISVMLFLYVFVNIGMVTGLLPVVGAPLPLISYGGTAMLTVFIGLGLVVNIALHQHLQDNDLL